jgi:hypothetical protein
MPHLISETLQPTLPAGLRARIEERILLETEGEFRRGYRGDVAVVETESRESIPQASSAAVLDKVPVVVEFFHEPEIERFVEIIDINDGGRVVTAIEILSPANKAAGRNNRVYRRKIQDYTRADVNVVEIDLLRSSRKRLRVTKDILPAERRSTYLISVLRPQEDDVERWACYPFSLRESVPPVPVPLRSTDKDARLELQPLLEKAYAAGGHADINYRIPPDPPLSAEDEAWADHLLRTAGLR